MPFLWDECTPHTLISLQCIRHCSVVGRKQWQPWSGGSGCFNATRTTPSHQSLLRPVLSNAAYSFVPLGPQGQGAAGGSIHKILLAINTFSVTKGTAPER